MSNITGIPKNINFETSEFFRSLKEAVEELAGNKKPDKKAATYQDLIDIGIIDKDFKKI